MQPTDGSNRSLTRGRLALGPSETALLVAGFDRMFPDDGDGYAASRMGAVDYVDGALAGAESENLPTYRRLFASLSKAALTRWGRDVVDLTDDQHDELISSLEFKGRKILMVFTIGVMSIPIASLLIPTFTLLSVIGLINTHVGLVMLYTAYQLPIVIWMLYGYFLSLPVEVEHAARIDGYTPLGTLRRVVLPLSKPALVAAALFVLVFAWNDFVVAVTMTSSEGVRTFPVAVYFYLGFYGREWGPLLASSVISIIPIIAIFIILQRYFISGLTGGGVKG